MKAERITCGVGDRDMVVVCKLCRSLRPINRQEDWLHHDCTIRTKVNDLTWLVIDLPAAQDARRAGYQITPGQAE